MANARQPRLDSFDDVAHSSVVYVCAKVVNIGAREVAIEVSLALNSSLNKLA